MRFIDTLKRHDREKTAVIADGVKYSYGEVLDAAAKTSEPNGGLWAVGCGNVFDELIRFLAAEKSVPVITADAPAECPIPANADFAVLSSGSTGIPKLIFRTAQSWIAFFGEQNRVFGIDENTVLFTNGSLCFSGTLNIVLGALYAGACVILTSGALTRGKARYISEYSADTLYLIPDKLRLLSRIHKCSCVKTIISGSQSMDSDFALTLSRTMGAKSVILYYGASEVSYISYIDLLKEDRGRSCVGLPFCGIVTECTDGFLKISTPCGAIGIDMPFVMGDIIEQDKDGFLYFKGRHDDVLNIGGEKLSAAALEDEIRAAGADDACVFTQRINGRDTLCCACTGGVFARSRLTAVPKRIYRLEALPKNANGKTDRAAVREMFRQ